MHFDACNVLKNVSEKEEKGGLHFAEWCKNCGIFGKNLQS